MICQLPEELEEASIRGRETGVGVANGRSAAARRGSVCREVVCRRSLNREVVCRRSWNREMVCKRDWGQEEVRRRGLGWK